MTIALATIWSIWLLAIAVLTMIGIDRRPLGSPLPGSRVPSVEVTALHLATRTASPESEASWDSRSSMVRDHLNVEVSPTIPDQISTSAASAPNPAPAAGDLQAGEEISPRLSESTPAATGMPVGLVIPSLEIDAAIEPIGVTERDEMAAPSDWDSIGWFSYGYRPGDLGYAVLTGHLDTDTGHPAVFYRLGSIETGAEVRVIVATGEVLAFRVVSVMSYPYDDAPIGDILGAAAVPGLNLITCDGAWDADQKLYDHRLVVSAELIAR